MVTCRGLRGRWSPWWAHGCWVPSHGAPWYRATPKEGPSAVSPESCFGPGASGMAGQGRRRSVLAGRFRMLSKEGRTREQEEVASWMAFGDRSSWRGSVGQDVFMPSSAPTLSSAPGFSEPLRLCTPALVFFLWVLLTSLQICPCVALSQLLGTLGIYRVGVGGTQHLSAVLGPHRVQGRVG